MGIGVRVEVGVGVGFGIELRTGPGPRVWIGVVSEEAWVGWGDCDEVGGGVGELITCRWVGSGFSSRSYNQNLSYMPGNYHNR